MLLRGATREGDPGRCRSGCRFPIRWSALKTRPCGGIEGQRRTTGIPRRLKETAGLNELITPSCVVCLLKEGDVVMKGWWELDEVRGREGSVQGAGLVDRNLWLRFREAKCGRWRERSGVEVR